MEKNQYIVALEIGSSKIVGAIAEKTSAGYLSVRHLQEERHLNSVRYGIVQNVENIKSSINRILRNLEGMIDGRVTQVYLGVSGRSLHSIVSEVNRSVGSTEAITRELIDRIIKDATSTPIRNYDTVDIVPRAYYVDKVEYEGAWKFWQHTDAGRLPGIKGRVDFNIYNGSYYDLRKLTIGSRELIGEDAYAD